MSLPVPPNRLALGNAPFASSRVSVSLPAPPTTEIDRVLATVGVPPVTATAPPFTRIVPAASRLITMVLFWASPTTVRTPRAKNADGPGGYDGGSGCERRDAHRSGGHYCTHEQAASLPSALVVLPCGHDLSVR